MRIDTIPTKLFLPILLLCFLANGLLWSAALPYNKGNDERLHFEMAQFLAKEGRIPVFGPDEDMYAFIIESTGRAQSSYALHPTTPYFISALFFKIVQGQAPEAVFHFVRLSSVLLGMGTVVLAYLMGRLLFPNQPMLRYALPVFVAFQPQFVFMHSYVNNDAFSILAASLLIYLTARELLLEEDSGMVGAAGLGFAIGLVVVSKLNAYMLIPFALIGYGWAVRKRRRAGVRVALLATTAALTGGWWLLWNYMTYDGDFLALRVNREAWLLLDPAWRSVMDAGLALPELLLVSGYWWVLSFTTYWGSFGPTYENVLPPMELRLGLALMALGSLIGLRYWLPALFRMWQEAAQRRRVIVLLGMLALVLALTFVSFFNSMVNAYQPQGRYLLPAVIPISVLVLVGISRFRPSPVHNDWLVLGVAYFIVGLSLLSLYGTVLPWYYPEQASYWEIFAGIASGSAWFFNVPVLVVLSLVLCVGTAALVGMLFSLCRAASLSDRVAAPLVTGLQPPADVLTR